MTISWMGALAPLAYVQADPKTLRRPTTIAPKRGRKGPSSTVP